MELFLLYKNLKNSLSTLTRATYDDWEVVCKQPDMIIQGGAALKHCFILSDKRHIITKDSNSNVVVYDVLRVIEYYQKISTVCLRWIEY